MNNIPLNKTLIDSFNVFLELSKIKVIDYKLITPYKCVYEETGELLDEINPPKSIIYDENGIKFRYQKVIFTNQRTKTSTDYILITVTSKMLREQYFNGINKDTYKGLVDFINSLNIIKIDYETFLNSKVNDIDLCINYKLNFKSYESALKTLYHQVKPSKQHIVSLFPKKETQRISENYGLTFSSRETSLYASPFIKFYNKTFEMLNNSTTFFNTYISHLQHYGLNINDIVRKEITIKNSTHKRKILEKLKSISKFDTVQDLFNISQIELDWICNSRLKYYYDKKEFHLSADLSPTEIVISYYMNELVNLGLDKISLHQPLNFIKCPVARARTKKKIEQLMDITFKDNYMEKKLKSNSSANEFIRMQGIW